LRINKDWGRLFRFLKEYSQDTKAGNKETFVWYTGTQKKALE
jgi:hypothetical protein